MKAVGLAVLAIYVVAAPVAEQEIDTVTLSESVIVLQGGGGNVTVIDTAVGLVIIDTFISPAIARRGREVIAGFSDAPVRYAINTHYHYDHTFGNQEFADAIIVAHANCDESIRTRNPEWLEMFSEAVENIPDLERQLGAAGLAPEDAQRIEGELARARRIREILDELVLTPAELALERSATLRLGGKDIRLLHFGPGHTDGDLVIHVPEENLIVTGDLVFHHIIPYIDVDAGADILNWIDILDELIRIGGDDAVVVPGHGEVGSIQVLIDQRDYLQDLWDAVASARERGLTLEQAQTEIALEQYREYDGYDQPLAANVEYCWRISERE